MPNDEMSREEAERWLAELTANPERMSAKMFQEGYEASLRKSGLLEAEISPLLRKSRQVYDDLIECEVERLLPLVPVTQQVDIATLSSTPLRLPVLFIPV